MSVFVSACSISLSLPLLRLGSHSTSDDQKGYQDMADVERWKQSYFPLDRLRGYLQSRGLWSQQQEEALVQRNEDTIKAAMKR